MKSFCFGSKNMKNEHPRLTPGRVTGIIALTISGLAVAVLFAFIFGLFVKLLWNWLMPDIFGIKTITYWQAWGLVLLSHLLIKGNWLPGNSKKYNCQENGYANREEEKWTVDENGHKKWEWHGSNFSSMSEANKRASDAAARANEELKKNLSDSLTDKKE